MRDQIFNEDCITGMARIENGTVDMVLCDLPYGTLNQEWDERIPFEPLWAHWWRVLKSNGVVVLTAQQPFTTDLINSCRKWFRYEIIWEKTQKLGFLDANRRPLRGHENVLVFYKKQPTYNPQKRYVEEKTRTRKQTGTRYSGYGTSGGGRICKQRHAPSSFCSKNKQLERCGVHGECAKGNQTSNTKTSRAFSLAYTHLHRCGEYRSGCLHRLRHHRRGLHHGRPLLHRF